VDIIRDVDHASQIAQEIEALEKKKKELQENLKTYTKISNEQIETYDGIYGWKPSETYRGIKSTEIIKLAEHRGLCVDDLLKPDIEKIKKFEEPMRSEFLSLGKLSVSSRWSKTEIRKEVNENEEIRENRFRN